MVDGGTLTRSAAGKVARNKTRWGRLFNQSICMSCKEAQSCTTTMMLFPVSLDSLTSREPSRNPRIPKKHRSSKAKACEYCKGRNELCEKVIGTHRCKACLQSDIPCSRDTRRVRILPCDRCRTFGKDCRVRPGDAGCIGCRDGQLECSRPGAFRKRRTEQNRRSLKTCYEKKRRLRGG